MWITRVDSLQPQIDKLQEQLNAASKIVASHPLGLIVKVSTPKHRTFSLDFPFAEVVAHFVDARLNTSIELHPLERGNDRFNFQLDSWEIESLSIPTKADFATLLVDPNEYVRDLASELYKKLFKETTNDRSESATR